MNKMKDKKEVMMELQLTNTTMHYLYNHKYPISTSSSLCS